MALDERLRRELEKAARPADPSGVYEDLIRRRERRRVLRAVRAGALTVVVVVGSAAGIVALSRVIGPGESNPPVPISPTPFSNGDLAYTDGDRIVIERADGSDRRSIAPPQTGIPWFVSWSPDGNRLAVAVFAGPRRSLWVMNPDGSDPVRIARADDVGRPSWHPEGKHITYASDEDGRTRVHIVRANGTGDRVIYSDEAPGTYSVFSSSFSPDGSEILFDAGTDVGFDIFAMSSDGSNVRQLTDTGTDYNPAWSPDGSQIVFTRQEAASGESDIFLMDSDASNVQRLTDDGARTNLDPQFSPDGAFITYTTMDNGLVESIIAMATDGSNPEVLIEGEVLGFSWQPVPDAANDSPAPTESPTPSPSDGAGEDLGLGFPVCNASSIEGEFAEQSVNSTVFVATRMGDTDGCPQADGAFNVIALDTNGDRIADTSFGPIECELECRAFSAPDVDSDGTDELLVVQSGGSVLGLRLYDITPTEGGSSIVPVTVAEPGDPEGGFDPGEQSTMLLGGDAFELYALQCGSRAEPDGPGLIVTRAESLPHDSIDAEWHAHQTALVLSDDAALHVTDVRDFVEPVTDDPGGPSFRSGETLCGSNLGP